MKLKDIRDVGVPSSAASRLAGRAVFLAGLLVWIAIGVRLLPYDFIELSYLHSLEKEIWTIPELMHPLFVPLLGLYRGGLSLLGYSGAMLLPLQWLNLSVGAATLAVLFRFTEEQCGDSLSAALAVLVIGYTPAGFWSGCLRSTPYAAASAATVACLILLSGREAMSRERFLWAGAAAGLAASFHMAAISLIPVAAVAAWLGNDRVRRFVDFVAALAGVLLMAYVVFLCWHHIGYEFFKQMDRSTFLAIEQEPMSSIYTSRSVSLQLSVFADSLNRHGGPLLIGHGSAFVAVAAFLAARTRSRPGGQFFYLAVASFFSFSAFFTINNTLNGFIFSALLTMPLILTQAVATSRWLRLLFIPFALIDLSHAASMMQRSLLSAQRNTMLQEITSLQSRMGPRDVLLTPGCPFPELFYLRHLHVLRVGLDAPAFRERCDVPYLDTAKALPQRVEGYLREGRKVLLAEGDLNFTPTGDVPGEWKIHQVFWASTTDLTQRRRDLAALRTALAVRFSVGPPIMSPGGSSYLPLSLLRAAPSPGPIDNDGRSLQSSDFQELEDLLHRHLAAKSMLARRIDYLRQWFSQDPQDRYVRLDLLTAIGDNEAQFFPEACTSRGLWRPRASTVHGKTSGESLQPGNDDCRRKPQYQKGAPMGDNPIIIR